MSNARFFHLLPLSLAVIAFSAASADAAKFTTFDPPGSVGTYPYAINASDICASIAPQALKDAFRASMEEIRKDWEAELKKAKRKKGERESEPRDNPRDFQPGDRKEVI